MTRALKRVLTGLGITIASVALFVLAAALLPGKPDRFYLLLGLALLGATLVFRLLGYDLEPEDGE